MITSDAAGNTTITGADISRYGWMVLRCEAALHLKNSMFKRTKLMRKLRAVGYTGRTLTDAWDWIEQKCIAHGVPDYPYPTPWKDAKR